MSISKTCKNIIKSIPIFNKIYYYSKSYSQDGADIVLAHIIDAINGKQKNTGFYVDVGAYHPIRYSNTYFFYKRGWSGINIDALPGSMKQFEKCRKRDINLEIAVGNDTEPMIFSIFEEAAYNTFDLSRVDFITSKSKLIAQKKIEIKPIEQILSDNIPNYVKEVDFFDIDVEGFDMDVLMSNNWERYSPRFILIEDFSHSVSIMLDSDFSTYLAQKGYSIIAHTYQTTYYIRNDLL